jgi:hypothetical protein
MPRAIDVHALANPLSEAGAADRRDWQAIAIDAPVCLGALAVIHPATLRMAAQVPRSHPHSIAAPLPVTGQS